MQASEILNLKAEMDFIVAATAGHDEVAPCRCRDCRRFCEIVDVLIYADAFGEITGARRLPC